MTYISRKVLKVGNGLYINVPSEIVKRLGIVKDDILRIDIVYGDITIRSLKFGSLKERELKRM